MTVECIHVSWPPHCSVSLSWVNLLFNQTTHAEGHDSPALSIKFWLQNSVLYLTILHSVNTNNDQKLLYFGRLLHYIYKNWFIRIPTCATPTFSSFQIILQRREAVKRTHSLSKFLYSPFFSALSGQFLITFFKYL